MIKVFDTVREYNSFVEGGLVAGDVYYVKEDESAHFQTNNIDGSLGVYDFIPGSGDSDYYLPVLVDASFTANGSYSPADYDADGFDQITIAVPSSGIVPTGTLTISSNGTYDVTNYASAAVSVPASAVVSGTLEISANGSNIDVTDYASVDVNVAIPAGYVLPSGTLSISSNGEFDCTNYASVAVNVAGETPQYTTAVLPSDYTALPININAGQTIEIHSVSTNRFSLSLVDSNGENIYTAIDSVPFYLTKTNNGQFSGILDDAMLGLTIEYRIF